MKLGFNHWTDEAREKIEELSVSYKREETGVAIYTDSLDITFEQAVEIGLIVSEQQIDKGRYWSQALRIWKHPESGDYYYLIKDTVFRKFDKQVKDYSTKPPTIFVTSIFDLVDRDQQDHYREILMQGPTAVYRPI